MYMDKLRDQNNFDEYQKYIKEAIAVICIVRSVNKKQEKYKIANMFFDLVNSAESIEEIDDILKGWTLKDCVMWLADREFNKNIRGEHNVL